MKRIMVSVLLAFFSIYASGAMAGGREAFTITMVGLDLAQQVFIVGVSPASTTSLCDHKSELRWNLADPGTKEVITLVFSARALGAKIQVGIASTCITNRTTGTYLYFE